MTVLEKTFFKQVDDQGEYQKADQDRNCREFKLQLINKAKIFEFSFQHCKFLRVRYVDCSL